jgi:hypothetical protein
MQKIPDFVRQFYLHEPCKSLAMTRYPRLHRTLVGLGAAQSLLLGFVLIVSPSLALALFLSPNAVADIATKSGLSIGSIIDLLLSFVGSLLVFYAFVMGAVAVCFDRHSIRIKGYGELLSGGLFLWIAFTYREYLVVTLILLGIQHFAVGITYLITTNESANTENG